ncbi:hypothetical protein VZ94_08945 [Methylocucumis oryzae]|uniref:PAS domain-containing protein n=2 Tax=Methylocucumis oryzae TaxID=1632867 RepID=A0A0F3IJE5_9GAMM|nr:hypothetical protein VZ94_08945 [Methylocucumis oryzae]
MVMTMPLPVKPITLLAVILGYFLLAKVSIYCFAPDEKLCIYLFASGAGLAAILKGGYRFAPAIFIPALVLALWQGHSVSVAALIALSSTLSACLGARLLCSCPRFSLSLSHLSEFLRLIVLGGVVAGIPDALVNTGIFYFYHSVDSKHIALIGLHWWLGHILGIIIITPMLLVWSGSGHDNRHSARIIETGLVIVLSILAGLSVFLHWFGDASSYLLFLLVSWAAVRSGSRVTTLVLTILCLQGLVSLTERNVWLPEHYNDWVELDFLFLMLALSLVGMALSCYITQLQQAMRELAEQGLFLKTLLNTMPDKVWVKSPDGVYLHCNARFEALYGAKEEAILGKTDFDFVTPELANFFSA